MATNLTSRDPAVGDEGYNPSNYSSNSGAMNSHSMGAEGSPENSVSRTLPATAVSLLPVDDPMDGTTMCPTSGQDAGQGLSSLSSNALESSSTGESISEESVTCENLSMEAEKEAEDKDKNDGTSALLFHKATERSMSFAACEGSGSGLRPPENQSDACTPLSISEVDDRPQQIMMNATDASSMEIGQTGRAAGGESTALGYSHASSVYDQKEKMNEELDSNPYNPNNDSSASSSSGSPDTSEFRKKCVSKTDSTQRQPLVAPKILEKNPLGTAGEPNVTAVERNVFENPETRPKYSEESNKYDDGVSCDRLTKPEISDVSLKAGPEDDVSKVSRFRQKFGQTAGDGLPGRASVHSESGVPTSEGTSAFSSKPQDTATVNEETSTEENTQFTEVKKDEGQSNIVQQLYGAGKSREQPQNSPAFQKESSRAMPSCETVKATGEKTAGSDGAGVSRFQAKLSETKQKGEFPVAIRKVNSVALSSPQNMQAPSMLPASLRHSTRQTESNIAKYALQPDQGTLNVDIGKTSLPESQTLRRFSVDQHFRAENSEKSNVRQPLHLQTKVLDEPHPHGEATIETKMGPGPVSFDMVVKQRLKRLKLKQMHEHDLKVLIEYCIGWFEGKNDLSIEQVPRNSLDNAGKAFKVLKDYVDSVEAVFDKHICLPQGQFSQYVTPLGHGVSKNAPLDFIEIIESRVKEFANEYEKRNKEIIRQEDEVMRALIGTAADYFENEAVFLMQNDYFEAEPLLALLIQIVKQTKESFLQACDIKFPAWEKKYREHLDEEIQRRRNKIQSGNERQRLKTQREIDETVDRFVREYTQDIKGKRNNLQGHRPSLQQQFQQDHLAIKDKIMKKIDAEFVKKWDSCPGLHGVAKKNLETKIEEVRNKEYENLVKQQAEQKGTAQYSGMATSNSAYSEKGSYHGDHNQSGRTTEKGASKTPTFSELPSLTLAIHMGLSRTRLGVFRPGTTEFQNIAEVDNCLYYRDDSFLLAYNDSDRQKLNPQDINFQSGLVQGPIDELHEVTLNAKYLQVRKEHIMSSILAVLKCKAELELQAKFQLCVIVVPQFLNETQRTCIRDAARIAGFIGVKIIDDTVAIALEYMMRKQERERNFIVACAMEGVVDVAKFHIKDGLLRRLEVSGTHFLRSEQTKKSESVFGKIFSFFTWSKEEKENILKKIFSNNELNLGKDRLEQTLKLFAGDTEMLNSIKSILKEARNFEQVSELNAIAGGAMFAALCEERQNCPFYSAWKSMRSRTGSKMTTFEDFVTEILSVNEKEKKRSSNPSQGVPMTTEAIDNEKTDGHLRFMKEVHGVALEAVKVIRSVEIAVSQKQVRDSSSSELLLQQLAKHKFTLQQPNLRLEEAKLIHDEALKVWHEKVLG